MFISLMWQAKNVWSDGMYMLVTSSVCFGLSYLTIYLKKKNLIDGHAFSDIHLYDVASQTNSIPSV